MLLTLLGNRRRILDAAKKAAAESDAKAARARQEGISIGRQEERQQIRQEMADWFQSAKEDLAAGRDPGPPPILNETGNSSNRAPY